MAWSDRHGALGTNLASSRIIARITPCNVTQWTPQNTPTFVEVVSSDSFHTCSAYGMGMEKSITLQEWLEIPCPSVKTGPEWNSFKPTWIQAEHCNFFYSHVPGWQGRLSETAKTISTKTIACQKLFSPWFDWWHHFLLTDMFTSSTFLLPSLPLLPSCSVKQVPSQELIVCSELKYPVIWGGI